MWSTVLHLYNTESNSRVTARQMSVIGQLDNGFDFENRSNSLQMCLASRVMYKGKERSTAVFAIVISKSKVCRRVLLLLGTRAFLCAALWLTISYLYNHSSFVLPVSS